MGGERWVGVRRGEEEGGVCGGGGRARCLVLQIIASPAEMCDQDSKRKEKNTRLQIFFILVLAFIFLNILFLLHLINKSTVSSVPVTSSVCRKFK